MTTPEPLETNSTATGAPAGTAPRAWYRQPALMIAAAAAILLGVQWYDSHQQMKKLQAELARRLAAADVENRESRSATEQVRESTRDAQSKLGQLEAKQHESQNQQVALEAMYQELARNRDESLLADIEQTLQAANQQIQATGNVRTALIALQSIEARLARVERPQLAALRKAVTHDIERLKLAPRVDRSAIAARLDDLAAGVDALPLLIEVRPAEAPAARKPVAPPETNPWLRFAREFWQDLRDLVRIEKIDNADSAPLAASQTWFLRENLRLRVLSARLALLAQNEKIYKADLKIAGEWLARYFDVRKDAVANAVSAVRQLHDNAIGAELPDVTPSLDAVRGVHATYERR